MTPQEPTNPFPSGYAYLNEWVTAAETRLQELDEEMSRAGVAPKLIPPTPMGFNPTPQLRRSRVDIQQDKKETKANAYKRIEKETETAAPGIRKDVQDIAFGRLYREEIKRLKAVEQGLASPADGWSLNEVQVKALHLMKKERDKSRLGLQGDQANRQQPAPQQPEKPDREPER